MKTRNALLPALLAALGGLACDDVPTEAIEDCESSQVVPMPVSTDILFVIDDSVSMGEEQNRLRDGLAAFIQTLSTSPIVNAYQIGVTTTHVSATKVTPCRSSAPRLPFASISRMTCRPVQA